MLKTLCICSLLLSPGREGVKKRETETERFTLFNFFLSHWKLYYKHHDPYLIQHVSPKKKNILLSNHNTIISPKKINDVCLLLLGCNCFWDIFNEDSKENIYTISLYQYLQFKSTYQGSTLTFPIPYLQLPSPTMKIIISPLHLYIHSFAVSYYTK